jgi:hypothetical protein
MGGAGVPGTVFDHGQKVADTILARKGPFFPYLEPTLGIFCLFLYEFESTLGIKRNFSRYK